MSFLPLYHYNYRRQHHRCSRYRLYRNPWCHASFSSTDRVDLLDWFSFCSFSLSLSYHSSTSSPGSPGGWKSLRMALFILDLLAGSFAGGGMVSNVLLPLAWRATFWRGKTGLDQVLLPDTCPLGHANSTSEFDYCNDKTFNVFPPKFKIYILPVRIGSVFIFLLRKLWKANFFHTVWCNISGEVAGEIWSWSLLGVKGLMHERIYVIN